jgi:hypothetical protein
MDERPEVENDPNKKTWHEEIRIAGNDLLTKVKELIKEGNVHRLIVKNAEGKILLEIPLTAGVVAGGVLTLVAPVLAALGAVAGLLAEIKLEVVRVDDKKEE